MYLFIERTIIFREMLIGTREASQEMQKKIMWQRVILTNKLRPNTICNSLN